MSKFSYRLMAGVLLLLLSAAPVLTTARAFWDRDQSNHQVLGIWTFRALFPGAPGPVFVGNAQFLKDGTITGPSIDQHSGATIGLWERVSGRQDNQVAFSFLANTYDNTGTFSSTHRVRGMMTVSDDGLSALGTTMLDVIDTAGNIIFSGTSTFTGERLTIQPF